MTATTTVARNCNDMPTDCREALGVAVHVSFSESQSWLRKESYKVPTRGRPGVGVGWGCGGGGAERTVYFSKTQ